MGRKQGKNQNTPYIITDDPMHDFLINFQLIEGQKIADELSPFLNDIRNESEGNKEMFKIAYQKFSRRNEQAMRLQQELTRAFVAEVDDIKDPDSVREQVWYMFIYLGLVESIGNCYVDILVVLMAATGRDFHVESRYTTPRIRHLTSIDDLEKEMVPLTTKLNFLRENGLLTFPSVIDSKLRNDIAHLNFSIAKDRVIIRKKPALDFVQYNNMAIIQATSRIAISLFQLAKELGWEKSQIEKKSDCKEGN